MKGHAVRLLLWSFILISVIAGCSDDPGQSAESLPSPGTSTTSTPATNTPAPPVTSTQAPPATNIPAPPNTSTPAPPAANTPAPPNTSTPASPDGARSQHPVHRRCRPLRREQSVARGPHRKHPGGRRSNHHKQRQRIRLRHYLGRFGRDQRARRIRREQRRCLADQRTPLRRRRVGAGRDLRPRPAANSRRRQLSSHRGWRPESRAHGRRGTRARLSHRRDHWHEPDRNPGHHILHQNR